MNSNVCLQLTRSDYECKPIRCFDELQHWRPDAEEERLFSSIPAVAESISIDGPKVLLCHDMKGGYLEDRFVKGSDKCDVYTFFHWSQIDLFVYFSHHLVTIPPITWTTAAHRNGVPMLGTFITEGSNGKHICGQFLSSTEAIAATVKQLVHICERYRFEGWLLNIENTIEEHQMDALVQFVSLLTQSMHERIPGSKVIWYDSVVYPCGSLSWQNELNSKNVSFFNACDAIFLNYGWGESQLQNSAAIGEQYGRRYDVYVGIDVFGRGCYGGGGMNTDLAVKEISKMALSMAIFAPGWVHEILGAKNFHENQLKFWSKLNLPIRRLLSCLPFKSNFCRGFGKCTFKNGVIQSGKPWCNLLLQDIQTLPHLPFYMDDGFEGGGCLLISDNCNILRCHISVPESGCLIILVHKPFSAPVNVSLRVASITMDGERSVILSPLSDDAKRYVLRLVDFMQFFCKENASENQVNGWSIDVFSVNKEQMNILSKVTVQIDDGEMNENSLLLGSIKILQNPASQFNDISIG